MMTLVKQAQELVARGAWREASALLEEAIKEHPREAELHNVLATAFIKGGDLDRADAALAAASALDPSSYKPWANRAIVWKTRGDLARSADSLREAIAREPKLPRLFARLGQTELERGRIAEAAEALTRAHALDPSSTHRSLLAGALLQLGRDGDALELLADAGEPEAASLRALALLRSERYLELGALLSELAASRPKPALLADLISYTQHPTLRHFALQLSREELLADADPATREAIALALAGLSRRYIQSDLLDISEKLIERALELAPRNAGVIAPAVDQYLFTGRHAQSIALGQSILEDRGAALFAMLHHEGLAPEEVADRHRRSALSSYTPFQTVLRAPPDFTPGRRLHLAFVSGDFFHHAVFRFAEGLLRELDRTRFKITAYFTQPHRGDASTERLARADVRVVPLEPSVSDDEMSARVVADGVDVLIDLAGWSFGQRLGVFARRPAPLGLTYLGWPATTGLGQIDGRVSDAIADVPGQTERLHSETVLRVAGSAWNFCDVQEVPIKPRPRGRLALASFQRASKISEGCLAAWARILHELPEAVLLLKGRGLGSEAVRRRIRAAMDAASVDHERVKTRSWTQTTDDHLGLWNDVDIALDTFPYAGTTTTCETLWMGVPVVTHAGTTHVSRVGASLLANVGLDDLVARDWDEYAEKAVSLARDDARLAALRGSLRERMRASLLTDSRAFAAHFGEMIEGAWRALEASGEAAIDAQSRRVGERETAVYVPPSLADRETFFAVERHYDPFPEQPVLSHWLGARALHLHPTPAGTRALLDLVAARPAGAEAATLAQPATDADLAFARFMASARRRGLALSAAREAPAGAVHALSMAAAQALAASDQAMPGALLIVADGVDPQPLSRALRGRGHRLFLAAPGAVALTELAAEEPLSKATRAFVSLADPVGHAHASEHLLLRDAPAVDLPTDDLDACALHALALAAKEPRRRNAMLEAALRAVPEPASLGQALTRARLGYELGRPEIVVAALSPHAAEAPAAVPRGAWLAPWPGALGVEPSPNDLHASLLFALAMASPPQLEVTQAIARHAVTYLRAGGRALAMAARIGVSYAYFSRGAFG